MKAEDFIKKNREQMIADIKAFAGIPSVLDEKTKGAGRPFGEKTAQALDWILQRGQSLGMDVKNFDGYAGEMTAGSGSRMIGILGHADVVAPGEGWNTEPFEIQEIDGKLYGRGTLDDKGPIISCLYAVKYLMEEKAIPEDAAIRFIVGCDEEEEWRCIDHYRLFLWDRKRWGARNYCRKPLWRLGKKCSARQSLLHIAVPKRGDCRGPCRSPERYQAGQRKTG